MGQTRPVIGMIGIGQLGLPVATNLLRAGYRVVGFRRTDTEAFIAAGGVALDSPAQVARDADMLLLCLPSEAAQQEVLAGPIGVLASIAPGKVVVDLGTYRREFKERQAQQLKEAGVRMLEAEVSGSPPMVAERRAALYIGGDPALFDECKPVLDAITTHHFHLGPVGAAVAMKVIANTLVAIHTLAAAEAINMGARAGFDPRLVADVIKQGAGSSAMFAIRAPLMAERRFTPALGSFDTLEKYLDLGAEMARQVGSANPLFDTAAGYFRQAIAQGRGSEDIAAVIELLQAASQPAKEAKR